MPIDAWVRLPLTIAEKKLPNAGRRPWIVPSAIAALDKRIDETWHVLELGSGKSTAWFAARAGSVLSVETDAEWYRQVRHECEGLEDRLTLQLVSIDNLLTFIGQLPSAHFDLVIVDFLGDRVSALEPVARSVKPGGYLLLDDADRYATADDILAGWPCERFVGVKPRPLIATATSLYRRNIRSGESSYHQAADEERPQAAA